MYTFPIVPVVVVGLALMTMVYQQRSHVELTNAQEECKCNKEVRNAYIANTLPF